MDDARAQTRTKSAFDILMGRDDIDTGSEYSFSSPSELDYPITDLDVECLLDYNLRREEIDPDIGYDEFFERFWWGYGFAGPPLTENQFKDYWSAGSWKIRRTDSRFGLESSYLRSPIARGCRSHHFQYDRCRAKELKRFVNDRNLEDPLPHVVTLKYYYLRLLEKADKERRFRFMALPPEMRLNVYRELLLFHSGPRRNDCETAILRVSREVNKEANGVLYDENPILCSIAFEKDLKDDYIRTVKVHNHHVRAMCDHALWIRIPDGIDDYPEFLRRVSRLQINVQCEMFKGDGFGVDHGLYPINHFLYTLASFLMDGHRLKNVQIHAELNDMEDFAPEFMFWPLRRLRNIKSVTVTGLDPAYEKKIVHDLRSTEPAFNTLRQWKLLQDEARAQLDLLDATYPIPECTCGECPLPEPVEEIVTHMRFSEQQKLECCLTSVLEEHCIARLAKLRDVLARSDIGRIERLAKAVKTKRTAWNRYKETTDEGRLDEAAEIWEGKIHDEQAKGAEDHDWSDDEEVDTVADTQLHGDRQDKHTSSLADTTIAQRVSKPSPEL